MTRPEPTRTTDGAPSADELLTAYADDPMALTPAERAAVEARCAAEPAAARELAELRALLGDVRAHGDVADAGPDWSALEASIRATAIPPPRRPGRWLGAGVALAAAAALAVWWHQRAGEDGPGLGLARLIPALPALPAVPAVEGPPAPAQPAVDDALAPDDGLALDDAALDTEVADALDALDPDDVLAADDALAAGTALAADDGVDDLDELALIGHALERVPTPAEDDGIFPGLDTEFLDDLSEAEVEEALRWLAQQGAG